MGRYSRGIEVARQTLVIDASVGVKWFTASNEESLFQALAIRDAHVAGDVAILVPDLFFYEVANAIIQKKSIPYTAVQSVINKLFTLRINPVYFDLDLMVTSVSLAREIGITVYDACYIAVAQKHGCPLVTANPRHQKQTSGCEVIPLEYWR